MMKTMRRTVLLAAAVVMVFAMVLACPEQANAETVLDSGTSGDCKWEYCKQWDSYYLRFTGGENGKMADYSYWDPAPWKKYSDTVEEIYFSDMAPVSEIGNWAFKEFSNLRKVTIYSVSRIGSEAFSECKMLNEIVIYGKGEGTVIESSAFSGCYENTDHDPGLNSHINVYGIATIGNYAFKDCGHQFIYFDEDLEEIKDYAFEGAYEVRRIDIPAGCRYIGEDAFSNCPRLESIKVLNTDCEFDEGYISSTESGPSQHLVLQGYPGSTTEQYAKAYGYKFIPLGSCGTYTIDLRSGSRTISDESWNRFAWRGFTSALGEAGVWDRDYDYDLDCEVCDFDFDHQSDIGLDYSVPGQVTILKLSGVKGKTKYTITLSDMAKEYLAKDSYYESVTFLFDKYANPLKVTGKTASLKYSKLKKKAQVIKPARLYKFKNKGKGKLSYAKVSGNKKITVNKKTGKITVKKGLKKGTYKVKVKVKSAGTADYKALTQTVTIKIKIKK